MGGNVSFFFFYIMNRNVISNYYLLVKKIKGLGTYLAKIFQVCSDVFGRYYKTDIKGAENGKLTGKKVAIKDNIFVAGVPMTNGSTIMEGFIPDEDATVVTRILDAGKNLKYSET